MIANEHRQKNSAHPDPNWWWWWWWWWWFNNSANSSETLRFFWNLCSNFKQPAWKNWQNVMNLFILGPCWMFNIGQLELWYTVYKHMSIQYLQQSLLTRVEIYVYIIYVSPTFVSVGCHSAWCVWSHPSYGKTLNTGQKGCEFRLNVTVPQNGHVLGSEEMTSSSPTVIYDTGVSLLLYIYIYILLLLIILLLSLLSLLLLSLLLLLCVCVFLQVSVKSETKFRNKLGPTE